jgi:hypothetical protein
MSEKGLSKEFLEKPRKTISSKENNRQESFETLWDALVDKGAEEHDKYGPTRELVYNTEKVGVTLEKPGAYYELEVFIGAIGSGFTTIDIYVLIEEVEDHKWCWEQLNKIGINKNIFE